MRPGIDLSQAVNAHFRINLGSIEPGVTEHLLDKTYVRAVVMHMGGATVPEEVTGALLADFRRFFSCFSTSSSYPSSFNSRNSRPPQFLALSIF